MPTQLHISGMTCASCAMRIERKLNRLDGVVASVNFATETASIVGPADVELLVETVESLGYGAAFTPARTTDGSLKARLVVSAVLAIPVLIVSMVPAWQFKHWAWWAFAFATPVVAWGGWPFHRAAFVNARHRTATMDTLISVGALAAYAWSIYALVSHPDLTMRFEFITSKMMSGDAPYFEVATGVIVLVLAGRFVEQRARRDAGSAVRALAALSEGEVVVLDASGAERSLPVSELVVGQRFVVRPGERVASDGVVESGRSAVDASLVTGESTPVEVAPGDEVVGATINTTGRLVVRATRVGSDTTLAQIGRLVAQAQAGKAAVQRLADRVAGVFVPVVIGLATLTIVYWAARGETAAYAIGAGVAVLVIACPCALGLATPTALLAGTGRGAELGLLIHGPEILESARHVDTILFDKTGTLTSGTMVVTAVQTAADVDERDLLVSAGAVEAASEHPVGRAIAARARALADPLPAVEEFVAEPGAGVHGLVLGRAVHITAPTTPVDLAGTVSEVRADGNILGWIAVADAVRPTSPAAVAQLRALGLHPVLVTGDRIETALAVAAEVGIDDVEAGVRPEDKLIAVQKRQAQGHRVAFVGDGVNDAAALAAADLGIAMGTGTDVARQASDLTLVRADLMDVAAAIELSRRTLRTIKTNLFWAFAYNVAAIPLAASGRLSPLVAAGAMAFSSVFVVSNSVRLRRFHRAQR